MDKPEVVVAAFADERSYNAEEHLKYFGAKNISISVRFFSFSDEAKLEKLVSLSPNDFKNATSDLKQKKVIKHITEATLDELKKYTELMEKYGVKVWDIGSAVGKQYLGDHDFRSQFLTCLDNTMNVAHFLNTRRVRSFTFYPGTRDELEAAKNKPEQLKRLFEEYKFRAYRYMKAYDTILDCERITSVLEVESNLFGHDGQTMQDVASYLCNNLTTFVYFDGANMVQQDKNKEGLSLDTYNHIVEFLLGLHVKDMRYSSGAKGGVVDEEAQWPYVPCGEGDAQYPAIFKDFVKRIPAIKERLLENELPDEVGVILEPHLMCGGQFGGFTGKRFDGAIRALTKQLDTAGIAYHPINV